MNYDLVSNIEICRIFKSQISMELINYSHIPVAILSLLIGVFVFIKNRELISKILLMISVVFSMWLFLDLLIWTFGYNSYLTMFSWSILGIFFDLFFILSLYFFYVFVDKKDLDSFKKIILFSLLIPTIILTPTIYNLEIFSLVSCEAMEKGYFVGYYYFVGVVVSVWLLVLAFLRYRKANDEFKKQILLMTIGMGLLLVSFSWANIIGSLTLDWKIIQYGFFGMPIFLGFLTYLIIRFKAFEIKLIGVQALVFILIILIGSQFTFIKNNVNRILTAITLLLATTFGWILVRSVKKAIQQKEALEMAYGEIENRNKKLNIANKENIHQKNQLQKLSNNLIKANIELKKLDEAKSDFVSMASHQLRTPPTPIKGYSSMLLEGAYGKLNSEQARAVENINKANNQQIEFVEDLLSVSRIESGSTKFEFKKQQIGIICQEIVDNLTFKAKEKNIFLKYEIPATPLPEIDIDGMKIREVLSNLIDNAIKYTPKGGVTVSTKICVKKICARGAKCLKKPHIRITISDTGIGIPANEIPYLFIKFSRGKDISRLNTGGTGLGLYVVKIITAANGGKVWIESPGANKGTKFILELPLEQEKKSVKRVGRGE